MKMKRWAEILLLLLFAAAAGAAAVFCAGSGALSHSTDKKSYVEENGIASVLMTGTGQATVLFSDEEDGTGRYVYRLCLDLYPQQEKPLDLRITVRYLGEEEDPCWDREEGCCVLRLEDRNPLYVTREVLTVDREHVISAEIRTADGAAFSLGRAAVENEFSWNYRLFLFAAAASFALAAGLLRLFRCILSGSAETPERILPQGFLLISLTLGTALVCCLPAGKVGCDEETHLQAVVQLASFPSNELHLSDSLMSQLLVTEYNNPEAQPAGASEQEEFENKLAADADYRTGVRTPEFAVLPNRVPAYLAMAAAVKAGKGLGFTWPVLLKLARFANLLLYTALIWLALKLLPAGGALLALAALLPQNLFLASTVSYDPFITGCLAVGTACFLRLLLKEEQGREFLRDTVLMLLFFLLGCLPKAVYAPFFLLPLLIPLRRLKEGRARRLFCGAVLFAFAAVVLLFILPTLLSPSASGDVRGGEVSEASQLAFIFGHPLQYLRILLSQMLRWIPQCFCGPDCFSFMGHLVNGSTEMKGVWIPYALLLLVLICAGGLRYLPGFPNFPAVSAGASGEGFQKGSGEGSREGTGEGAGKRIPLLRLYERAWILLLVFGTSVLIWTAMYVTFTEPGAGEIAGVQGRYFIPLLFPLYFALGAELPPGKTQAAGPETEAAPEKELPRGFRERVLRLVRADSSWYYLLMIFLTVLPALQIWAAVVRPYCL